MSFYPRVIENDVDGPTENVSTLTNTRVRVYTLNRGVFFFFLFFFVRNEGIFIAFTPWLLFFSTFDERSVKVYLDRELRARNKPCV